jgi:hypothetical protein
MYQQPPQGPGPQHPYQQPMMPYAQAPMFAPCRACGYQGAALVQSKISSGGWVLFILMTIFLCWPLCWIPLVTMKDRRSVCAHCKVLL